MFDFSLNNIEKKVSNEMASASPSTECEYPLVKIEDGIIYLKDGYKEIVLTLPGKDISIMEDEAQEEYAEDTAIFLSGITGEEFAIQWIPEKIDSEKNLNLCLTRLDDLQQKYYNMNASCHLKKPLSKRIELLQDHVLPKVQNQAVSNKCVSGNTYLWIKFLLRREQEINNDVRALIKRIDNVTGRNTEWVKSRETILNLIENWTSNSTPLRTRRYNSVIVAPDYMKQNKGK